RTPAPRAVAPVVPVVPVAVTAAPPPVASIEVRQDVVSTPAPVPARTRSFPRAPAEIPATKPPKPRSGGVLRAALAVLGLAVICVVFVLARNDWRFDSPGVMMSRAFAPHSAQVHSQVPGVIARDIRRVLYENPVGERMLIVSGGLHNSRPERVKGVTVL